MAKCLVDSIGKYTKTLEALTNYMRRGNPPTSVSEFNAKLLRISKVISEAVQTAEHFGLTESCDVLAILSNTARLCNYKIDGLLYCASNHIYQHKINFL